jgi:hypothetical protein
MQHIQFPAFRAVDILFVRLLSDVTDMVPQWLGSILVSGNISFIPASARAALWPMQ